MAMKPCRECKQEISTEGKQCPHCGKKYPTGGWSGGAKLGVGLLVLYGLGQAFGDRGSSPSSAAVASIAPAATNAIQMPDNQRMLLEGFQAFCNEYDAQPNEIKKSAVFRASRAVLEGPGPIKNWTGTLKSISTNQGGSRATLKIRIGSSDVADRDIALGSPVYAAASEMVEGQAVTFSGRNLKDFNLTERGKVCEPNFEIRLTALK